MANRIDDTLGFQGQALLLRSERQRLLASNIANADTPGYVAREMNFAQALRAAVGAVPAPLALSQPGHIAERAGGDAAGTLRYATASQNNLDRNSVDMDRERAAFADNSLRYEAALRFINGHVRTMTSAITGQ